MKTTITIPLSKFVSVDDIADKIARVGEPFELFCPRCKDLTLFKAGSRFITDKFGIKVHNLYLTCEKCNKYFSYISKAEGDTDNHENNYINSLIIYNNNVITKTQVECVL